MPLVEAEHANLNDGLCLSKVSMARCGEASIPTGKGQSTKSVCLVEIHLCELRKVVPHAKNDSLSNSCLKRDLRGHIIKACAT